MDRLGRTVARGSAGGALVRRDPGLVRNLLAGQNSDGLLRRVREDDGAVRCVLCGVCARACPVSAITVARPTGGAMARGAAGEDTSFVVDEPRCIGCGSCVSVCRLGALVPGEQLGHRAAYWQSLAERPARLKSGHGLCSGCAAPIVVRQVLSQVEGHYVASVATGCLEVSTTIYPHTSWDGSFIHTAFENAAATLSGVESAYRALKRRGRLRDDVAFIAFGGDGGTYDIGLQALSGAVERGHRMLYVCYDNGAYMNTGFQRSGATPFGAWTSTTPAGAGSPGKTVDRKPITEIMLGHRMPYVAQASPHDPADLMGKAAKALATDGPSFLNILSPCPRGWRTGGAETIDLARQATETCVWPLFEAIDGRTRLTYRPARKQPVREWLCRQGRFAHLFEPGCEGVLDQIQAQVDDEWSRLLERCGDPLKSPGETSLAAGRDGTQAEWRQVPECGVAGARQSE